MVLAVLFCANGCRITFAGYKGEFPELYTIAVNSFSWAKGYSGTTSEPSFSDPRIKILEEDSYGRKLYHYYENNADYGDDNFLGLIISQKAEDEFVYYYPDDCAIVQLLEFDPEDTSNYPYSTPKPFPKERVEELKEKNNWDQEILENKCIKMPIILKKVEQGAKR